MSNPPTNRTDSSRGGSAAALGRFVEWAGDRLNPILVKETRQALKSRQFTLWFVLLLAACWVTTIGAVAVIGPSIYYVSAGGYLLYAYFVVLTLPLVMVVPFSAYRSLSSEQEENTRDLLEVSRLTTRQIINGKLASAALQIVIYLSALAPCIAFTYLLRGVDVSLILLLIGYAVLASFGLSAVGLLIAALTKQKYTQVVLSVMFAGLLFSAFTGMIAGAEVLIWYDRDELRSGQFWGVQLSLLLLYLTTYAIVYQLATAATTFTSANRSTGVRVALVVQQTVFIAWCTTVLPAFVVREKLLFLTYAFGCAAVYWCVVGAFLTGEPTVMSQRVRRSLPQSLLGRVLLSWFNPGAGSGYVFTISNLALLALLASLGCFTTHSAGVPLGTLGDVVFVIVLMLGYAIAYLGIGRLAIYGLRRLTEVSLLGCFLIQVLFVLGGTCLPYLVQTLTNRARTLDGSLFSMTSPYWNVSRVLDGGLNGTTRFNLAVALGVVALVVFVVNLTLAAREAQQVRVAKPKRVIEDDREQQPQPETTPTNPWGDTPATEGNA